MKTNEEYIDFGSWTTPKSWDDITLLQFQEIERLSEEQSGSTDIRDMLYILCNKTKDEVNELPIDFLDMILEKLSFMQEPIKEEKPINYIMIDGEKYTVHTEQQLKTGEYIASDTLLKSDKHNYAALLAILCRKEGELYDSHFENEVLQDRIKVFEGQPITKILPIISFFLQSYIASMIPTQLSSKVEEALDLTQQNIETLRKNGELSRLSTRLLMRRLKKLRKSIKSI